MKKYLSAIVISAISMAAAGAATEDEAGAAAAALFNAYNNDSVLEHVYGTLPQSPYRDNIDKIKKELVSAVDKDIWNKTISVLSSVTKLFDNDVFYESEMGKMITGGVIPVQDCKDNARLFSNMLGGLTYDKVSSLPTDKLIATMDKPVSSLFRKISVSAGFPKSVTRNNYSVNTENNGTEAEIRLNKADGYQEDIYLKKEGTAWILKNIADAKMDEVSYYASKVAAQLKGMDPSRKTQLMTAMDMLEKNLKSAAATKNLDEMDTVLVLTRFQVLAMLLPMSNTFALPYTHEEDTYNR